MRDFKARAGWLVTFVGGPLGGKTERRPWAVGPEKKISGPDAQDIQLASLESEAERYVHGGMYERRPLGRRVTGAPGCQVPDYYYEYRHSVEDEHAA